MTDHTPTPWTKRGEVIVGPRERGEKRIALVYPCPPEPELPKADSEFILLAVNNHDALVAALTDAVKAMTTPGDGDYGDEQAEMALAVLAAVKGDGK